MPKVQPPELKGFMDKRLSGKGQLSGSTHKTLTELNSTQLMLWCHVFPAFHL